jgi:ribokinase
VAEPSGVTGPGPVVVVGAHAQGLLLHVDAIPKEGESVLGHGFEEPMDGGKASNQAVALARLGVPVRLLTVVGSDERGGRALAYFREAGVDVDWSLVVDGPTDVGFVLLPPNAIPAIATAIDRNVDLDAAFVRSRAAALEDASVVVCQLEAPPEIALEAFRLARGYGARTILNPSPVVSVDPELYRLCDVLVPNEHEAAELAGRDGRPGELAAVLGERLGARAVVVTAGADGAYVAADGRVEHVPTSRADPVDTTGAGDAFLGAVSARLRAGESLLEAAAYAVRAATIKVERSGTMPSFATASEVAVR